MPREALSLLVTAPITLCILWLIAAPLPRYRDLLSVEDYAVYSAALDRWDPRMLVSRDLVSAPYSPEPWSFSSDLPSPDAETLEDFEHVNKRLLQLEVAPLAALRSVLTTNRELRGLEDRDDRFRVWVSRVGFNREWTEAVVYVQSTCGRHCGSGDFLFLNKVNGSWRIRSSRSSWVA